MNCYYSNFIEGHQTHPRDTECALTNDLSADLKQRNLQLEAKAHIELQVMIDREEDPPAWPTAASYLQWLHFAMDPSLSRWQRPRRATHVALEHDAVSQPAEELDELDAVMLNRTLQERWTITSVLEVTPDAPRRCRTYLASSTSGQTVFVKILDQKWTMGLATAVVRPGR